VIKIKYKIIDKVIDFKNCSSYAQIADEIYNNPKKYFSSVNKQGYLCCRKCKEAKTFTSIYNKIRYHRYIDKDWLCKTCANMLYKPNEINNKNNDFEYQSSCKYGAIKLQYKKYPTKELIYYISEIKNSKYVKFGVTKDLDGRSKLANSLNDYNLINSIPLVKGCPSKIIDLEYDIKLQFALRNKDGTINKRLPSATETFSKEDVNKIKQYIKDMYPNYNLLY